MPNKVLSSWNPIYILIIVVVCYFTYDLTCTIFDIARELKELRAYKARKISEDSVFPYRATLLGEKGFGKYWLKPKEGIQIKLNEYSNEGFWNNTPDVIELNLTMKKVKK